MLNVTLLHASARLFSGHGPQNESIKPYIYKILFYKKGYLFLIYYYILFFKVWKMILL